MIRLMMEAKFHHETAGFVNIIQLDRTALRGINLIQDAGILPKARTFSVAAA